MADRLPRSPFEILLDIEHRHAACSTGARAGEEFRHEWLGVAFELRRQTLLAPISHVAEVLAPPALTSVPGVKLWVLGLANMRGNLLPVLDLQGLLYGKNVALALQPQRVMVVNHAGISAGLLVDAVLGIKHFRIDERIEDIPALDVELQPFVAYGYRETVKQYGVFELAKFIESEMFLDVAI